LGYLGFTPELISQLKNPAAQSATQPPPASTSATPEATPPQIQEIYNAVKDVDEYGKYNDVLLDEAVGDKIKSLRKTIADLVVNSLNFSRGRKKTSDNLIYRQLAVELAKTYTFYTGDGNTEKTTIYDYVSTKYSSSAEKTSNQIDQLSLVMVALLNAMGWEQSQANPGTYVNIHGLIIPTTIKQIPHLGLLPLANDNTNIWGTNKEKYKDIILTIDDNNFQEKLTDLNNYIKDKMNKIKNRLEYLNSVKYVIEQTQGRLSENNIITLKMTIVVWKVLSMTPVQQNLPDQYLVDSINPFDEGNFTNYLDMMMEVFEDDDEKELYFTGKYRLKNGKSYIIDSNGNFNVGGSTQPQSLLDLIKLHTLESDRPTMIDLIGQKFPAGSSIRTLIEGALAPAQPDVTAAQSDNPGGILSKIRSTASGAFGAVAGLFSPKQTPSNEKQGPVESSSSGGGGGTQTVGGRKLRKTKKKKANKKKNRKTRSKKSKNQRKKK
jgi:hypothetical protein